MELADRQCDLEIILIRHAQSVANTLFSLPALHDDSAVGLSDKGLEQAANLHAVITREFLSSATIYCSPYLRAIQTLGILLASHRLLGARVIEENVRLFRAD